MENAIINVNGQILPLEQAKVSVFDRSYLYGDSLYEVARTHRGRIFALDEHLARLAQSAELCRMTIHQKPEDFKREIQRTVDRFWETPGGRNRDAYIRIIVSRGEGRIGFGLSCLNTPSLYTLIVAPLEAPTEELYRKGFRLQVSERLRNDPRALDPAMKSGNYLNSLLAYLDAASAGFDDALLCNLDGHLTEGTTFNIFYVRRGIVATPPLDIGILDGITRRQVMGTARRIGVEVREVRFPRERLYEADEVFLTSTIKEVFPVTRVDQIRINNGKPGPVTQRLLVEFRKQWLG